MKLCGFDVGIEHPLFLIAGPCVIESEQLALDTAGQLKEITAKLGVPFIYKSSFDKANRSAAGSFRGPGIESGLKTLDLVRTQIGVPVLTDVHEDTPVGEVAAVGEQLLTVAFGRVGRVLHRHSRGIDHRPVLPPAVKAACRIAHQFATDTNDRNELRQTLRTLTGQLGQRLRRRGYAAGRLKLTVRHSDDAVAESSARLRSGALDGDLWSAACSALDRALTRRITVRSVTICAEDLHDGHGQLELWPDTAALLDPRAAALQQAMDAMRRAVPRPRTQ